MEAVTRLFLVRPPRVVAPAARPAADAGEIPIDGTLDFEAAEAGIARMATLLARLARRPLAALVASPCARSRRVVQALAEISAAPARVALDLRPRHLGAWQGQLPSSLGAAWGRFLADRRRHAAPDAEPLAACEARVLAVLDLLAREHPSREVVVVLHADGVRAALATALASPEPAAFAVEPGQAVALDWAHPDAREFQHGVVGIAFDWDVAPPATKVQRFPGGASVLPRTS